MLILHTDECHHPRRKASRHQANYNALRSNEKHIKNVENYLYGTMQNLFDIWWNKQAGREYAAKHPEEEKSAANDNSGLYY